MHICCKQIHSLQERRINQTHILKLEAWESCRYTVEGLPSVQTDQQVRLCLTHAIKIEICLPACQSFSQPASQPFCSVCMYLSRRRNWCLLGGRTDRLEARIIMHARTHVFPNLFCLKLLAHLRQQQQQHLCRDSGQSIRYHQRPYNMTLFGGCLSLWDTYISYFLRTCQLVMHQYSLSTRYDYTTTAHQINRNRNRIFYSSHVRTHV